MDLTPNTDQQPQAQPQARPPVTVHIPNLGVVHFPDHMSMDEIHVAAKKIHDEHNAPTKQPHVFPVDPDADEVVPRLDTERDYRPEKKPAETSSPPPPVTTPAPKGIIPKGVKQFRQPFEFEIEPLLDSEPSVSPDVATIPPAGRTTESPAVPGAGKKWSIRAPYGLEAGGGEATEGLEDRGSMRQGWDSNPKDAAATQKLLDQPAVWREEDENLRRSNIRTIGSRSAQALSQALDDYDAATPAARTKLEKQIFQKLINYRRDSKHMEDRGAIDKRVADYSNALARGKTKKK